MKLQAARTAAVLASLSLLFVTCGEMDSLYSSSSNNNGMYQVRTLVNDSSLEECSIIRSQDKIRPYFVASVVNDPDLTDLLVYLLNSQGEIVGERVRYTLQTSSGEPSLPETPIEIPEIPQIPELEDDFEDDADEESGENVTEIAEETTEAEPEPETLGRSVWDIPEQGAVRERWGFTNTKTAEINTDKIVNVRSFEQELPYFLMPKNLEPGVYNLVFEALGGKGVLSRTETDIFYLGSVDFTLKDISLYLPTLSGSQLIAPGTTVMLEAGLDFDSRLDPYVIWYRGRSIISEGKISDGAGTLLWKAPEQAGFYPVRVEAFPIRFKRGLTGVSREITLPVSPKALNTGYFFDYAPQYAAQSPLAAGVNYPEQIRLLEAMAALTEEDPEDAAEQEAPVPPAPPELLRWYQFKGNLLDSAATTADGRQLAPDKTTTPQWAAVGQSYGLSVSADNSYSLSPVSFFKDEQQGGGIFLLHVKPHAQGLILSAFFPLQASPLSGVQLTVTGAENAITLTLSTREKTIEMPVYVSPEQSFFPVVVEFYIRPYRMEAKLSLGESFFQQHKTETIALSGALTGEARITLGGALDSAAELPLLEATVTAAPDAEPADDAEDLAMLKEIDSSVQETAEVNALPPQPLQSFVTIWNELAVLYSGLPLVEEDPVIEDIFEEAEPQTAAALRAEDSPAEIPPAAQAPAVPAAAVIAVTAEPDYTAEAPLLIDTESELASEEPAILELPAEISPAELDDTGVEILINGEIPVIEVEVIVYEEEIPQITPPPPPGEIR